MNDNVVRDKLLIEIDILNIRNGLLHVEGHFNADIFEDDYNICIDDKSGNTYELHFRSAKVYDIKGEDGRVVMPGQAFSVNLPIDQDNAFHFVLHEEKSKTVKTLPVKMGYYSRVSKIKESYFVSDDKLIYRDGNNIVVEKRNLINEAAKRLKYDRMLRKKGRQDIIELRKHATALRKGKPIWLLCDRSDRAGDNAEALLKYLKAINAEEKYRIFFAISKDSKDYERMQQYGTVIDFESEEHKAVFLAADKFISSQWTRTSPTNPTLNPFRKDRKYVQDMLDSDFVFLQHGVTLDDMSEYGCKSRRNVRLFITTGKREYEDIISEKYGYTEDEVILSGFTRYDYLINEDKKKILIAPTRRVGQERLTEEEFKKSEFYNFYNNLINDKKVLGCLKKFGYSAELLLHPVLIAADIGRYFDGNDIVHVECEPFEYSKKFREGSLLLTDYSSVATDFAYMEKPIIYAMFDKEAFFGNGICGVGYFDYEKDGFGPVCKDYDSTVKALIKCIEDGCSMTEEYKERVNNFFEFHDRNNCERVFKAIENIGK